MNNNELQIVPIKEPAAIAPMSRFENSAMSEHVRKALLQHIQDMMHLVAQEEEQAVIT